VSVHELCDYGEGEGETKKRLGGNKGKKGKGEQCLAYTGVPKFNEDGRKVLVFTVRQVDAGFKGGTRTGCCGQERGKAA